MRSFADLKDEELKLPTEYPFPEAIRRYGQRLASYIQWLTVALIVLAVFLSLAYISISLVPVWVPVWVPVLFSVFFSVWVLVALFGLFEAFRGNLQMPGPAVTIPAETHRKAPSDGPSWGTLFLLLLLFVGIFYFSPEIDAFIARLNQILTDLIKS